MAKKKNNKSKKGSFSKEHYKKLYRNAYQRAYRRKQKIDKLDPEKKGYKSKRSELYKEITSIHGKMRGLARKAGIKTVEAYKRPIPRKARYDISQKTRSYTANVWQFEKRLSEMIKSKRFKKIHFVGTGKTHYVNISRPTTILHEYDLNRDAAYSSLFAGTPKVYVTEDYEDDTLTLDIRG